MSCASVVLFAWKPHALAVCGHITPSISETPIPRTYYFYDEHDRHLSDLQHELETRGYGDATIGEGPCWPCEERMLKIHKTDALNSEQFHAREAELCALARDHSVESFWSIVPKPSDGVERGH